MTYVKKLIGRMQKNTETLKSMRAALDEKDKKLYKDIYDGSVRTWANWKKEWAKIAKTDIAEGAESSFGDLVAWYHDCYTGVIESDHRLEEV